MPETLMVWCATCFRMRACERTYSGSVRGEACAVVAQIASLQQRACAKALRGCRWRHGTNGRLRRYERRWPRQAGEGCACGRFDVDPSIAVEVWWRRRERRKAEQLLILPE
jgi:hypothetical protein